MMRRNSKRTADDDPEASIEALSSYEKTRLLNIQRNNDYLKSIGLEESRQQLNEAAAVSMAGRASSRGVTKKVRRRTYLSFPSHTHFLKYRSSRLSNLCVVVVV
jgi:hypothetical protein